MITLSLIPQEEARLIAAAKAKGISTDALIREAVDNLLDGFSADAPGSASESRPIWDVILDNMSDVPCEEFAKLPGDGASEHDHYLYKHPKRSE